MMTRYNVKWWMVPLGAWMVLITQYAAHAAFPLIGLEPVSENEIVAPVGITHAGDGSNRMFITDQRGTIHVMDDGNVLPTPLLDISSKLVPERQGFDERGLLGLTFHPNFGQSGLAGDDKFYVYYSAPQPDGDPDDPVNPVNHQSILAEYSTMEPGSNVADPNSERILMQFDQPQFNHNAGFLGFGPDDLLYITTGDGGGADDNEAGHTGGSEAKPSGVLGNAQDLTKVLGKVLRIDPQGTNGPGGQYGIPEDNPFVGEGGGVREEIFAYGLRNPWRGSFDDGPGGTGRFFLADVGQLEVEEVNIVEAGGNYGWRIKEGTFDFDSSVSPDPPADLIDPIAEYGHPGSSLGIPDIGLAVVGGAVYRGSDFPQLDGKYIFGDWSSSFNPGEGTLLGLEETSPGQFDFSQLDVQGGNPLVGEYIQAFGLDENGEVYMATRTTLPPGALDPDTGLPTGTIYRIVVIPEPSSLALLALLGIFVPTFWSRRC